MEMANCEELLKDLTAPPDGSAFRLLKVERLTMPHPYCITPRHVAEASDNFGGMLNEAAIESAEKHGAHCGTQGCRLAYGQHETSVTLFIGVPQNGDLNAVPGLHRYLLSIKERAVQLGISGFAFPELEVTARRRPGRAPGRSERQRGMMAVLDR
jgi:hypothetical protein